MAMEVRPTRTFRALVCGALLLVVVVSGCGGGLEGQAQAMTARALKQKRVRYDHIECVQDSQLPLVECDIFQRGIDFFSCNFVINGQGSLYKLNPRTNCDPPLGKDPAAGFSSNLSNMNLSNADLSHATLGGDDLSSVNLKQANLYGANLTNTNLTRANLTAANLAHANLYGANLTHANLTRANLTGAKLSGARLTGSTLSNTVCPDGTSSNKHGGSCLGLGV
jgi:hypothetical protein